MLNWSTIRWSNCSKKESGLRFGETNESAMYLKRETGTTGADRGAAGTIVERCSFYSTKNHEVVQKLR